MAVDASMTDSLGKCGGVFGEWGEEVLLMVGGFDADWIK
jgi:hypothetical protein